MVSVFNVFNPNSKMTLDYVQLNQMGGKEEPSTSTLCIIFGRDPRQPNQRPGRTARFVDFPDYYQGGTHTNSRECSCQKAGKQGMLPWMPIDDMI